MREDIEALWAAIEAASPLDESAIRQQAPPGVDFDEWFERAHTQSDRRRNFIAHYGWSVPDRAAVEAISAFLSGYTVLELFAGAGLWSRLLSAAGVSIRATDANASRPDDHFQVEALEAEAAVVAHRECDALFFSWPTRESDAAFRAVDAFLGQRLAYVGDVRFTGDKQLQDLLAREWILVERVLIPAWPGLDDYAYLYSRSTG